MATGLAHYIEFLTDTNGDVLAGASVEVRQQGLASLIADTLYATDNDSGATLANPLTTDADGKIEFYLVVPQRVDLRITASGFTARTVTVDVMHIEPSSLTVLNNGASTGGYQTLDFIGGDVTVDTVNEKLVIEPPAHDDTAVHSVDQPPEAHASDHATAGADAITPASIGAADTSHAATHATGGGDDLTPADIGAADAAHTHDPGGETFVMPSGAIVPYGGTAAPSGWLLCDGSAVSRTTYADLFTAIGTAFGIGDGSTTFNIPNLQGRFPLGKDTGGTGSTLGGTGGSKDHTHASTAHTHTVSGSAASGGFHGHSASGSATSGTPTATTQVAGSGSAGVAGPNHQHSVSMGVSVTADGLHGHSLSASAGSTTPGDTGTNNPPFVAVNYIVKT